MKIQELQQKPDLFFSQVRSNKELIEKFGNRLYAEKGFDKAQSACAYALFLSFTSPKVKNSTDNEEFIRAFFKIAFNETLSSLGRPYYDESLDYLKRAFKSLAHAEKYKVFFESLNLHNIDNLTSPSELVPLIKPFTTATPQKKFTLIYNCILAMILSDVYEVQTFKNLKILCDKLKLGEQDRWNLLTPVLKIGSLKLKDVSELTEKDKMFIYIQMVKDLYENDGQVDEDELETIDKIERFLNIDQSQLIQSDDYVSRSFLMASEFENRGVPLDDVKVITFLAMTVIGLDGVQDAGEIIMLKKLMGILDNSTNENFKNLSLSVPPNTNITDISEKNQLYCLLVIVQMMLADDEIQKEEMEFLFDQLKLILKSGKNKSTDADLLCFLEIITTNIKWLELYPDFFKTFKELYTTHIKNKQQIITRIVAVHNMISRQNPKHRINENFIKGLTIVFSFNLEEVKLLKSLLGMKVYEEDFTSDGELYLLLSFMFILKSLVKNFEINPDCSNKVMGSLVMDINKHVPITRYHEDTYRFLFGWI